MVQGKMKVKTSLPSSVKRKLIKHDDKLRMVRKGKLIILCAIIVIKLLNSNEV